LIPELSLPAALGGCFATCSAYAWLLTTKRGKRIALDHTWLTVVIGVSLVLAWVGTQQLHSVLTDFAFFAAGGTPLVLRSLYLWATAQSEYVDYLRDRGDRHAPSDEDDAP
jgi:hypothetical protein